MFSLIFTAILVYNIFLFLSVANVAPILIGRNPDWHTLDADPAPDSDLAK
jgi:hypothetical protein